MFFKCSIWNPALAVCWLIIFLIYGYSYEWGNGAGVFIGMAMIPLIRYNGTYATEAQPDGRGMPLARRMMLARAVGKYCKHL